MATSAKPPIRVAFQAVPGGPIEKGALDVFIQEVGGETYVALRADKTTMLLGRLHARALAAVIDDLHVQATARLSRWAVTGEHIYG